MGGADPREIRKIMINMPDVTACVAEAGYDPIKGSTSCVKFCTTISMSVCMRAIRKRA